ncbi:hypothetical protein BDK92_6914 [Micromonospora pisi]|uniref:PPC domain-containing protein n=1 Tax=Micromonospora pisi TaxID=589240 RepID=A0A495JU08_9ACTN|nr:PPC domain-containing DNA-binding protein [Micromonospora pisi]RKR92473.1 hypothetical protein BDK92_6914 [Micromonospora pisi]
MHSTRISDRDQRVLVVVCEQGEEAVEVITGAVRTHGIKAAQVSAVGGFSGGEVGYYDREARDYTRIPVDGQVEVLSLLGDIVDHDGRAEPNLHAVLGRRDGSVIGGHLLTGTVWPTLEVVITEVVADLGKRFDPATGIAVIRPTQQSR